MRLTWVLGLASMVILAACSGSDGMGPGGPITRLTGEWDVMFTSEPSHCGGNVFHGGFGIGIDDSVRTDSRVDVAAPWQAGRLNGYYTTDGAIALTLWSEDGSKAAR